MPVSQSRDRTAERPVTLFKQTRVLFFDRHDLVGLTADVQQRNFPAGQRFEIVDGIQPYSRACCSVRP